MTVGVLSTARLADTASLTSGGRVEANRAPLKAACPLVQRRPVCQGVGGGILRRGEEGAVVGFPYHVPLPLGRLLPAGVPVIDAVGIPPGEQEAHCPRFSRLEGEGNGQGGHVAAAGLVIAPRGEGAILGEVAPVHRRAVEPLAPVPGLLGLDVPSVGSQGQLAVFRRVLSAGFLPEGQARPAVPADEAVVRLPGEGVAH